MISRSGLTVAMIFCVSAATAQVQSIGDVSFAVPEGWLHYSQRPGENHATLTGNRNGGIWTISVFKPLRSSGNPDADFRAAWAQDVRSMQAPKRSFEHKGLVGYSGRCSSTNSPDGRHYLYLCVLEAGQSGVPVLVTTPNRRTFDDLRFLILDFIEGVRVAPARAQPVKENISFADLIGEWHNGGDSRLGCLDSQNGTNAVIPITAHGVAYTIRTDGTYTYSMAGMNNRWMIPEQGTGNVEVKDGLITLRPGATKCMASYHVISCLSGVDGSTVLTLLQDTYEPSTASINSYAEKWVRRK